MGQPRCAESGLRSGGARLEQGAQSRFECGCAYTPTTAWQRRSALAKESARPAALTMPLLAEWHAMLAQVK